MICRWYSLLFGSPYLNRLIHSTMSSRPIRDILCGGYHLDAVSPEYRLVVGTVVAVAGKAIQLPYQHGIKQPLCAVLHHALKFRVVVCLGGKRPVNVAAQNHDPVFLCVFPALPKLSLNAFFPLIVAAVSGINHRLHPHHLRLLFCRGLGSPKVRLVDIQTLCFPNQSPAGKTAFPAPHTTTTAAGKLSPTRTNSSLKSIDKSTGWESFSFPARRELSTKPLPFFTPFF